MVDMLIADPMGSMMKGFQTAAAFQGQQNSNALAGYRTREAGRSELWNNALSVYGAAALAGDENALAALGRIDPIKTYDLKRKVTDDRRGDVEWKFALEDRARGLKKEEIAAERAQLEGVLRGAATYYAKGDREGYEAFLKQNDIDPAQYPFEQFEATAAKAGEVINFLHELEDRSAGPEFAQITGEEARARGLDPAKVYNVGKDGKITSIGGGDTNVTVNTGTEFGKIPQGHMLVDDPDAPYGKRLVPIAGGEDAREVESEDRSSDLASAGYNRKYNLVDDKISEAVSMLEENGSMVAGWGSWLSNLPETDARTFKATVDTIKANLGFEELQAMRDASPTGGALGQVTERELAFLQSVEANLDTAQSPEQLIKILTELRDRRAEFKAERDRIMGGGGGESPQGEEAPQGETGGMPQSFIDYYSTRYPDDDPSTVWEFIPDEDKAKWQN